jgi:hypothetical protein
MITSREKKESNIAEYVLYMWQIEDLIRAYNCDMSLIKEHIIKQYDLPAETLGELTEWYENLVELIKSENKEEKGHIQFIVNTVHEINNLHIRLLKSPLHINYHLQFSSVEPIARELEAITEPKPSNDIELMLSAIYNSFLIKLKGDSLSDETSNAIKSFAKFLAVLSVKYREEQEGKLELED